MDTQIGRWYARHPASIAVIFAAMWGWGPGPAAAQSGGIGADRSIVPTSNVGGVPEVKPSSGTVPSASGAVPGSGVETNPPVGARSRAVTPGGLETTPGNTGANISNTPSNITPATTPPLQ